MHSNNERLSQQPVVPFIRECDFAVRSPWQMPERRLLDFLLIYVQEGSCLFTVDGEKMSFGKGEFCLVQPGSTNKLEGLTDTVTPFAHFDIFYNPQREDSFPTRAGQMDLGAYAHLMQPRLDDTNRSRVPVRLRPKHPVPFRDTFLQVVEFWQSRDFVMQLKAQAGMTELVASILEDHGPHQAHERAVSRSLNWISSYFSYHLSEPLSVEDMARRANMSASRFSAVFKKQYGVPPHRYLLEMRISHAEELLRKTELSQEEIAAYCGFANVHHFSKSYKNATGIPPGQVRTSRQPQ